MLSKLVLSDAVRRLLARERAEVLAELQRTHRRWLDDNPEGSALIEQALGSALLVGVRAQCELDWLPDLDLDVPPAAWEDWQSIREETPEGRAWPKELVQRKPDAVERAGDLLEAAAAELDRRRREREDLRWMGEQCAEAGAALVRSLTQPKEREPEPMLAEPARVGAVQPDGTVCVALTMNRAECDLLQGMLRSAGIPSIARPLDHQGFWGQPAGRREIYVPAAAAAQAQEVLATSVRE